MTFAVIQYVLGSKHLGDVGKLPAKPASPRSGGGCCARRACGPVSRSPRC